MNEFDLKAKTWDNDPVKIDRAFVVAKEIRKTIPHINKMKGFEYGCGTGLLSFSLQPFLEHLTLADSSEGMLEVLHKKILLNNITNMSHINLDLTFDSIPDEKYNIIYTLLTLHHILILEPILNKFYRMLEPGGYLCIADLLKEDGSFHGEGFTGHNGFDLHELSELVTAAGFYKICYSEVYTLYKGDGENKKGYPLFLMIATKE